MDSIPFSLDLRADEAGSVGGSLRVEDRGVVLEWMRETRFFPRERKVGGAELPFAEVARAEVVVPWFRRPRLLLFPRSMARVNGIPGVHPAGQFRLFIERSSVPLARSIVSMINLRASEALLQRATDPLDRP